MLSNAEIVNEYFKKPRAEARDREMVERPPHYCHGGLEAKDVIAAFLGDAHLDPTSSWWWGNAIKYLLRWPYKGVLPRERLRDLDKAIECIEQLREAYEDHEEAARKKVHAMLEEHHER